MNAFATAARALAADANLSESATYIAPDGARTACRVIRYQRDPLADMGQHHVRQAGWMFSIRIAEVALPMKGGSLEIGNLAFLVLPWDGLRQIIDVQLDEDTLTHRVSVR